MYNKMLKIAVCSIALNIFFTPLNNGVAKIFGYITIIAACLHPALRTFKDRRPKINVMVPVMAFVVLLSMILNVSSFDRSKTEAYFISVVSFVVFYWSLSFKQDMNLDLDLPFFFRVNYFLCFVYILYAFGPFDFKYMIANDWGGKAFNMGLGNPNSVSGYVLFSLMLLVIQLAETKNGRNKVAIAALSLVLLYILYLLSSRTVLFCALSVMGIYLLKRHKRFGNWIPYIIMLIPVLMILVQLYFADQGISLKILGKKLTTGRDDIYRPVLEAIHAAPYKYILGNVFQYNFENLHNGPLTVIASLGMVGFAIYWRFWHKQLCYLNRICGSRRQTIAFACVLMFIIHSSAETMFVTGAIPYSVFVLCIVKIAKGDIK